MNPSVLSKIEQIRSICALHSVESLHLFGSQASSYYSDNSDIDFLVKFSDKLDVLNYADNYFDLLEDLQNLFNKKIDLISERSLKNPILIEEINRSKVFLL